MKNLSSIFTLILCASLLGGCAKNMNSNVYTEGATPGKVLEGTIINARAVTIKAHDKLQDNTAGGLGGAAAGGLAGSQLGRGNGSWAGGIGGALIGAVGGAYLQDALSTQDGTEYLVKLDKKYIQEYDWMSKKTQTNGKQNIEQDMTSSTNTGTKSDIVSVVQANDPAFPVGSHVYIVYSDDRPRLVADPQK